VFAGPGGFSAATTLVAGFVAGGGMGAALVSARADRRQRRRDTLAADVREAQERLDALRDACRRCGFRLPGAPGLADILGLGDQLATAARRALRTEAVRLARVYVEVATEWAKVNTEVRATTEDEAYEVLAAALAERLAASR
jgi:hypothetical protein